MIETPKQAARRFARANIRGNYKPEALHAYTDHDGKPLYWRIRARLADGSKWIRPMRPSGHGFELGEPEFPSGKPLYRLHEVAARRGAPVWYVEGELKVHALQKLQVLATTAGSASSDERADFSPLAGRAVTVWPDNDAPGIEHAARVAAKLRALGCAVELIDARALSLPESGDVVDWIKAHPDATAADLAKLPRVQCVEQASQARADGDASRVELVCGSDIRPEPIEWLWHGWLAAGKLHMIAGAPEAGKTSIALALAATLSTGGRWPDGTRSSARSVVIWSGEDAINDTLIPRLVALGTDVSRIKFVRRMFDIDGARPFDPAHDMPALQAAIGGSGAKLLIVDPIVNMVAGDSHENAKVRRALQPVVDLADAIGCAVLGVSHFSKGTAGRDPVERVTGSVAFGALPRLVFAAAKLPEEEGGGRIFVRAKSNIGLSGGGFGYTLEGCEIAEGIGTAKLLWGTPLDGSARTLLSQVEVVDGGERSAIADAAEWLRGYLSRGVVEAREVLQEGDKQGFPRRTIQYAKDRIGAKSKREGFGKGSRVLWMLPGVGAIDDIGDNPERVSSIAPMGRSVTYEGADGEAI